MDLRIRHADDRDCATILSFVRATLQDIEAVGGDPINPDKNLGMPGGRPQRSFQ